MFRKHSLVEKERTNSMADEVKKEETKVTKVEMTTPVSELPPTVEITRPEDAKTNTKGGKCVFNLTELKGKQRGGKPAAVKYALVPVKPTVETLQNWLDFWGIDISLESSYRTMKAYSVNWFNSAVNDEGAFRLESFITNVQKASARGETFAALAEEEQKLSRLLVEMSSQWKYKDYQPLVANVDLTKVLPQHVEYLKITNPNPAQQLMINSIVFGYEAGKIATRLGEIAEIRAHKKGEANTDVETDIGGDEVENEEANVAA